jgi:preprotein translocase subunit SecB
MTDKKHIHPNNGRIIDVEPVKTSAPDQAKEKLFNVEKVYVKKLSLEIPDAPESFLLKGEVKSDFEFKPEQQKLSVEDTYETTLNGTVKIKLGDKELAICNILQSGIFKIKGFSEEEQKRLSFGYCPDVLYPYFRQTLANMLNEANLPPIILQPISFEMIYQQQLDKQKKEAAK